MFMKTIVAWIAASMCLSLLGCIARPDERLGAIEQRDGKFPDTPGNREHYERVYRHLIAAEMSGGFQGNDWKSDWRRVVEEIEENTENPGSVKAIIRRLRSEAGLPVWDFMK